MFNVPIDEKAPVVERQQVIILASREQIWNTLTNINQWTQWQKSVTSAQLKDDLRDGASFDWKAGGLSFKSKIHTCKPLQFFGWTGKTFGASAIHNWTFQVQQSGTLILVEESLDGFFPKLFKKSFSKNLKTGMQKSLQELKDFCETKN